MILRIPIFLAASLTASTVFSADIAKDIRDGGAPARDDGGYFEFGGGYEYVNNPRVGVGNNNCDRECDGGKLDLSISGAYSFKGVFIELAHGSQDGLNLGYNLLNTEHWSLDLLGSSASGLILHDDTLAVTEAEKDQALIDRDTFYNGAGIRATGYWGDTIFQYRLVSDIHDSNGITSSARLGRSWQVKNWNLHAIASADFSSEKTNDFRFGVTKKEATNRFTEYHPDASVSFSAEAGLSYPISEHFVGRSSVRYIGLPNTIKDSPLIDDDHVLISNISIHYVF